MSWGDFFGGLADAIGGTSGGKTGGRAASRPAREPAVERLPARGRSTDELAAAEDETRRMMQEAARDMARDFLDAEVSPWRRRIEEAESKVIDMDSNVASRLDKMESSLDEMNRKAFDAERFEARLNVLIALVAALMILVLWFGTRG